MLTVKELIEKLAELPPDLEVLVASDNAGNDFFPLEEFSIGFAEKEENPRRGGHYAYEFHHEAAHDSPENTGEFPGENAVVLWPS